MDVFFVRYTCINKHNLTNDPHEREKVSVIPRFFASLAGFSVATFGPVSYTHLTLPTS